MGRSRAFRALVILIAAVACGAVLLCVQSLEAEAPAPPGAVAQDAPKPKDAESPPSPMPPAEPGDAVVSMDAKSGAIRAGLEWLLRHQDTDGGWKSQKFIERCAKPCANARPEFGDGRGLGYLDVGVTGLALLAFAGSGQTHRMCDSPEFGAAVRRGVHYLKSMQVKSDDLDQHGRYGSDQGELWVYNHAIATMAMAELLVMSNDVMELRSSVKDATNLCLRMQNPGAGWKYGVRPGKSDSSVTAWMVLALKTAKNTPINVETKAFDAGLAGARAWFASVTDPTGRVGYETLGDKGSLLGGKFPDPYPYSKEVPTMTSAAMLCRLFCGEKRSAPHIQQANTLLHEHLPRWQEQEKTQPTTINYYYWYFGSYAMFQFGGKGWRRWHDTVNTVLIEHQRHGGDEDGSWDPLDEWGQVGGRVYSTAMAVMALEVYYRFELTPR